MVKLLCHSRSRGDHITNLSIQNVLVLLYYDFNNCAVTCVPTPIPYVASLEMNMRMVSIGQKFKEYVKIICTFLSAHTTRLA